VLAVGVGVGVGVAVAVRVAVAAVGSVMLVTLVMMLALHVTPDPPTFPVPLHWLTVIGIAGLTLDLGSTVQCTVPPPPLPDPLHWVIVAPALVAGKGPHFTTPPVPEPTHWFTVEAVTGCAPGVFRPMLFVTLTLQLIMCAASLSELLHCLMVVTRLTASVVNVPFGAEHGPSVHSRVTVVVEYVLVPLIVLTTVTVHFIAVVAPSAAGPWPLHWSTTMLEAWAAVGRANPAMENAPVSIISAITNARQVGRGTELCA
jgi:hypothetical protein